MKTESITRETAIEILRNIRTAAEYALSEGVACVRITLWREHHPTGVGVLLYGHSGPRGKLLKSMPHGNHWKIEARFRAARLITCTTKSIETILKSG